MHKLISNPAWAWPAIASLALGACGQEQQAIELRPEGKDPPAVVRKLSIGGQLSETESASTQAVNCAAALGITVERMGQLGASAAGGSDIGRQAVAIFRNRAVREAGPDASAQLVDRAIQRRMIEKREDGPGQARLSLACLRSVEGENQKNTG